MRARKAFGAVACATTLCLGIGVAATGGIGAGAATPRSGGASTGAASAAKAAESAAVRSAFAALQRSSKIASPAARQAAVQSALAGLEASIKSATRNVKPSAAALAEERSPAVKRAEQLMGHPGSVAVGKGAARGMGLARAATYGSGFQTSSNWSGYVDTNDKYDYVFGEWTVPYANCGPWYDFNFSQSSTWVGLDGESSNTVEQLGTATGCVAGASVYYAWTEMYPQIENPIWNGISPGDQIMSFVYSYDNDTQYELYMADLSQGWSELRIGSSSSPLQDSSAEWITERPTCGPFCDNLTNFGTTTFTDAYAMDQNYNFGSINAFPNAADDMYTNTYCAVVGGLVNGGTQFTDWWTHS
jgi:hypothetical protein